MTENSLPKYPLGASSSPHGKDSSSVLKPIGSLLPPWLILITLFFMHVGVYAQGPGVAWQYYRPITLSPVTPSANFQVKVTLVAGQYGNMKSDGSDLRFYDNAGQSCNYWIEVWNNAANSVIWVKVPTSGANTLIMYYGNAGASAVSNGAGVFDFFDGFDGSSLGANWTTATTNGSITVSGGNATLSNTSGGGSPPPYGLGMATAFSPASTSYFIEVKHREGAYNRNRIYASATSLGYSPLGFDYGYFRNTTTAGTPGQIFWNGAYQVPTVNSNTDYLTSFRITDNSTYNWATYNYPALTTVDSRSTTYNSLIRYITFGVTEVAGTSMSVDWVRVRQYAASEPSAMVLSELSSATIIATFTGNSTFTIPYCVTSITVEAWGGGGKGSTGTSDGEYGGGGGGAYAKGTMTVIPGQVYDVFVGAGSTTTSAGGDSRFRLQPAGADLVRASGGSSLANNTQTGALGGTAASSLGDVTYDGGRGGNGSTNNYGGGGGSSAGQTAAGNYTANTTTSVGGIISGGGSGGNGATVDDTPGSAGLFPGGGGGGPRRNNGTIAGGNGANGYIIVSYVPLASSTAPTSITGTSEVCSDAGPNTLTSSGGSLGEEAEDVWYEGGCANEVFTQEWTSQPYTVNTTNVNGVSNGVLSVTSTNGDAGINMMSVGSFAAASYGYIQIRYRVTAGTAGLVEIYFSKVGDVGLDENKVVRAALISDNAWHIVNVPMNSNANWTGTILGWRFDYCTNSGVTMDIDYITLADRPIYAEGASISVQPAATTTYYTRKKGACNSTTCVSLTYTVNPVPTASVTAQSDPTCYGGSDGKITITASGGTAPYEYSVNDGGNWTASGTNPYQFTNLVANQAYRIKVKDSKGCVSK
jgi:hypothetical protein